MNKKSIYKRLVFILFISMIIFLISYGIYYYLNINSDIDGEDFFVKDKAYILEIENNNTVVIYYNNDIIEEKKIVEDDGLIISMDIGDLNYDGIDEVVLLTGKKREDFGDEIHIYSFDTGLNKIYEQSFASLNPWKVQVCNVDGDDIMEVSIGVYKKAKFHPVMAKRPFIYNWQNNKLFPKWRGSRLSRPFEDYIFIDIDKDGRDELISIEILRDDKKAINTYKWKGFGFEGMGESEGFDDITSIKKIDRNSENFMAKIRLNDKIRNAIISYGSSDLIIDILNK